MTESNVTAVFERVHEADVVASRPQPGGKVVIFWPHAQSTSVKVLGFAHWISNGVLDQDVRFHPPEPSLIHSKREAKDLLAAGGLELVSYDFGPKDLFVQAVVVARRPS